MALVVWVGVMVAPGPMRVSVAHACSCADPSTRLDEMAEWADAAFLGTLVEIRRPELALSSGAESRFVFDVEAVFKGDGVRTRQSVVTASDGASCGLELSVGTTALVFARVDGIDVTPVAGEFASSLCDVVARPAPDEVQAAMGQSQPPIAGSSPIGSDDAVASTVVRNWYWFAALVVGSGLLLGWRLRRRRST